MRSSCVPIMQIGASRQGLIVEDMDSVYIPVPPINELNEIVRYLKESFSKINIAISIHRHQMLMLINNTIEPLYMQGPNPLGPTLKLFQSSKIEKAKACFVMYTNHINVVLENRICLEVKYLNQH